MGGYETPLTSKNYPGLQIIYFTLAALAMPRDYAALVLSSIISTPELSEISLTVISTTLDQGVTSP